MDSRSDSRAATLAEEKELERSVSSSLHSSLNKETQPEMELNKDEAGSVHSPPPNGEEEDGGGEYPTGIRMTFIVVALVLSIFLVSVGNSIRLDHMLMFAGCP